MNKIPITKLEEGKSFSDDAYVLDDLFFMPKNIPIGQHHLSILREWEIADIQTEGGISNTRMDKIVEEDDTPNNGLFNKSKNEKSRISDKTNDIIDKSINDILNKSKNKNNSQKPQEIITVSDTDNQKNVTGELISIDANEEMSNKYKKWLFVATNFINEIVISKAIDKTKVKAFVDDVMEVSQKKKNSILMFFGKPFQGISPIIVQSFETTILTNIIGISLNLSSLQLSNLTIATLFHDIGMLRIPRTILQKKEKLTPEELKIIQNHTTIGYKYLKEVKYSPIIGSGALQHHERIDGKGYPGNLPSQRITDIAKIIAVADAYCAAIASKPFKTTLHAKNAIQDLLKGGGTRYSPNILRELVKNVSLYPIGSYVILSDQRKAQVIGTSGVAMRPVIQIVSSTNDDEIVDLSKRIDIYIKGIFQKTNK